MTYGEACEPQAWAAATLLACLRALDRSQNDPELHGLEANPNVAD